MMNTKNVIIITLILYELFSGLTEHSIAIGFVYTWFRPKLRLLFESVLLCQAGRMLNETEKLF